MRHVPVHRVTLDADGPVGPLPDGVTWDPVRRIAIFDSDQPGHLHVYGDGFGSARRTGSGDGDAFRRGSGDGSAARDGDGDRCAFRRGSGTGDAVRSGSGDGAALRIGSGDGSALRIGSGSGSGNAVHNSSGDGDAFRDGSGEGSPRRGTVDGAERNDGGDAMAAAAQAAIPGDSGVSERHKCGQVIRSNRRKCILVRGHGGHCRSR